MQHYIYDLRDELETAKETLNESRQAVIKAANDMRYKERCLIEVAAFLDEESPEKYPYLDEIGFSSLKRGVTSVAELEVPDDCT